MEDHFTQRSNFKGYADTYVDLWDGAGPDANNRTGQYSVFRDAGEAVRVIEENGGRADAPPMYLHVMFQTCHSPYQVPPQYLDPSINDTCARTYHGMATAMDEGIGNITKALQAAGLWEETLMIMTADNGAPTGAGACGNNYPLRGGKTSSWEGGVRASAFASGGYIPAAARGTVYRGLMHVADWYSTLARLVGVDPTDDAHASEGVPPVDSVDQWAALTGATGAAAATAAASDWSWSSVPSPRSEVPFDICTNLGGAADDCASCSSGGNPGGAFDQAALIIGDYKLVVGTQHGLGFWTGPQHPNGTKDYRDAGCPLTGCLFNVYADPTEHVDLAAAQPARLAQMQARLRELAKGVFQTNFSDFPEPAQCLSDEQAAELYGGHIGPQCGVGNGTASASR
jgi:arylsulfatase I/J